ncbi:MAG: histidine ammonia-lyase [Anaerolineae bacterium]|nr:histidine ammonia-lyase [Anaerolineae bacterium]
MSQTVHLDGNHLTLAQVAAVADGAAVALTDEARQCVERSREQVLRFLARGEVAYGITTGFGAFKDRIIPPQQIADLQHNLVRSHAAGVGPPLDERLTRATMLIRTNTLAKGYSGVRVIVLETLLQLLNRRVCPVVPAVGSLGASGDLAPLAHLALVLIGEGDALYQGEWLPGAEALARAGIAPLALEAKEGLALLNGTATTTALAVMAVLRAENVLRVADVSGALSLEALRGTTLAFDPRIHDVRPHPHQAACAANLRQLLAGSTLVRGYDPHDIQDPYSLRCMPQVHGAVRDAVAVARERVTVELNAATDNPLIFEQGGEPMVLSGGNFHAEPIGLVMDYVALALADLGNISERRIASLMDACCSRGLPAFLTRHGGVESGLMIAHYTAAALASENKVWAHPATVDTIPTSANMEDHVSMATTAAHHCHRVLDNVERILAIELLCAAQGIDFRRELIGETARLGQGTRIVYEQARQAVPFLEHDAPLAGRIELLTRLICGGDLALPPLEEGQE